MKFIYEIFIKDVGEHLLYPTDEATASEIYVLFSL